MPGVWKGGRAQCRRLRRGLFAPPPRRRAAAAAAEAEGAIDRGRSMTPNVSIRARLIFLSILLLAILAVSSALLIRELARNSQSLAEEAQLVSVVRNANSASKHFGDLKYWVIDSAVSQLARSQQAAAAAKARLDSDLKAISAVDPARGRRHRKRSRHHDRTGASGGRSLLERRQRRRQRPAGAGEKLTFSTSTTRSTRSSTGSSSRPWPGATRRCARRSSRSSSRSSAESARWRSRWASPR